MSRAIRDVTVVGAETALGQALIADLTDWGYQLQAIASEAATDITAVADTDAVVFVAAMSDDANAGAALGSYVQSVWQGAVAAGQAGAQRFVLASGIGVYGLNRGGAPWQPLYFPIDERHPIQPADHAGLAHALAEQTVAQLATRHNVAAISLRLPRLASPDGYDALRQQRNDAAAGQPDLWTYLDLRDAARALRFALETPEQLLAEAMGKKGDASAGGGHVALNVVAATSTSLQPTVDLLASFYPDVPALEARLPGQAPPVTGERAVKAFNFTPRYGSVSLGGH